MHLLNNDVQIFVYLMASIVRSSLCSVSPTNSWTATVIALISVSGDASCLVWAARMAVPFPR